MKFIDFFSGAGGMRQGLERAGHTCVGFCEWDKYARQSYKAIFNTEGEWENHDIRTASSMELPKADLWTYGFPCQDISVAGKQKGLQEGERSGLFYQIIRLLQGLAEEDRPEWLLAENVKNLLSIGRGWDFGRVLCALGEMGYDSEWQVFNTKHTYTVGGYIVNGIPQNRERVYIVSHLRKFGRREVFPIARADGENTCKLQDMTQGQPQFHRVYKAEGGCAPNLETSITKIGRIAVENIPSEPRAVLTPDREEKRQNGRRMKDEGEPMFTLTAQDRHGIAINVVGNYSPSNHNASRVVSTDGIAPTVMENHGTVTAVVVNETDTDKICKTD